MFEWDDRASVTFEELKKIVAHPPILRLSDFLLTFTIEYDASGLGLRAILVSTVKKWRPYLLSQSFKIKIDQQAFQFLLEQRWALSLNKFGLQNS